MRHLQKPLGVLFVSALFLAGCAGAPETSSDAPRAAPPPPPSRPQPSPAPQPRTSQPDAGGTNAEGMTVFELQERLNELGYKVGTVDGVMGPKTVEALKKYQGENKLNPSGAIDPDTMKKLRAAIK
jgi:peptidoglycan hydrolase-like protein with peptidoglycan-binding domain